MVGRAVNDAASLPAGFQRRAAGFCFNVERPPPPLFHQENLMLRRLRIQARLWLAFGIMLAMTALLVPWGASG
jgi:hypothetical protein